MAKLVAGYLCFCGLMIFGFGMLVYVGKPVLDQALLERQCYTGYLH